MDIEIYRTVKIVTSCVVALYASWYPKTYSCCYTHSYSKGTIALPRVRLSISFPGLNLTLSLVVLLMAACI
jgi:hypothetical protein